MKHRHNFKFDSPVKASSLLGQKIIGNYRGPSGSLGVFVLGIVENGDPTPKLHKCSRVSMEANLPPSAKPSHFKIGQLCQGKTSDNLSITGEYQQSAGTFFSYIRGCPTVNWPPSPLDKKAYKVMRSTLIPLNP